MPSLLLIRSSAIYFMKDNKFNIPLSVQNAILTLLLLITSQAMILAYLKQWPLSAIIGLILLTSASIGLSIFLINKQDQTGTRKEQYIIKNIPSTFEDAFSFPALIGLSLLSIASEFILSQIVLEKTQAHNINAIQKNLNTNHLPILIVISLTIIIFVIVTPIVEELMFRQLIPMIYPDLVTFVMAGIAFIALHVPNNNVQFVSLVVTTSIFIYARMKYNLIESIFIHQAVNAFAIFIMLIPYLKLFIQTKG